MSLGTPPEVGVVYGFADVAIDDFPTKILVLASWEDAFRGVHRAVFLVLSTTRYGEIQDWSLNLPSWNMVWKPLCCTSDDATNHQGDTCPIHEV